MGSHEFMMMRGFLAFGLLCYILMFAASLDGTWYQSLSLRLINNSSSDVLPDHATKPRHEVKNEEMDLDQEQRKGIRNCDDHCNFLRDSSLKFPYSTLIKSSDPYSTTNNFDSTSSLKHRFISPFHKSFYEGYIDDHNVQAVSGEDESSSLLWQSIDKVRGFLGLQVERKNLLEIPSISEALHLSDSPAAAPSPLHEDSREMKGNSRSPLPAATPQNIIKESPSPLQSPSGFVTMPTAVSKQNSGNTKTILKAVILTAVSTSLVAFMVFCFYQKCILNGSGWKTHKDEKPLLSASLHDTSLNRYYGESKSFNWGKTLTFNQASATSTSQERVGTECSTSSSRKTRVLRVMSLPTDLRKGGDASNFHSSTQLSAKPHYQVELANISSLNSANSDTGTPTLFSSVSKAESSSSSSNSFSAIGSQQSTNKPPPPPPVPPPPARTSNSLTAGKSNSNAPSPPPPPPNISRIPPPLPPRFKAGPTKAGNNSTGDKMGEAEAQQPKLKPFHWDKVSANTDHSMVWDQLRAGSFQFNEEMITTLFGYNNATTERVGGQKQTFIPPTETLHFLEQKKSQNLAIVLRALNVTKEEIRDALLQGEGLSTQVIEALVKMAPTKQEEKKLKDYQGDVSRLATAERFLKSLIDVPFVFERLEAILFKENFREEAINISESFKILEAACIELRSSRLFLKLLEAVLKTGNRMNVGTFRGGAQAFKLDTLLKLADVKGTDGKTTLLHFVVQEIIRAEGIRVARSGQQSGSDSCSSFNNSQENGADGECTSSEGNEGYYRTLGLEVLANLSTDLHNVRRAAGIDSNTLTNSVLKLSQGLLRLNTVVQRVASVDNGDGTGIRSVSEGKFCQCMMSFIKQAEEEVNQLQVEEKKVMSSVRKITEYFHGDAAKEEAHPFRIFVIVRDFTGMLDKVCKEVGRALKQKLPPHDKPANSPFPMKYGKSYSSDDE